MTNRSINFFVAGPWNHGGWARSDGGSLGKIKFDSNTSQHYREKIEAPWFAYWLKDKGKPGHHRGDHFPDRGERMEEL